MLPNDPADITAEWLAESLVAAGISPAASIRALHITPLAAGAGLTGQIARIELEYHTADADTPRSLIAKLPPRSQEARAVGQHLRLFEREHRFYQEISAKTPLRTPRCYRSQFETDTGNAVLLLEDFSFARAGDQLTGWTTEEAMLALRQLAGFHAEWWDRPELEDLGWMPGWDTPETMELVTAAYRQMWPAYVDNYGADLPSYVLTAGERLGANLGELAAGFAVPPHTITHGDFRMDNLFFWESEGQPILGVIDWQLACRGRGAFDVAYFLSQSGPVELRRLYQEKLLRLYHESLLDALSNGGYGFDEFFEDYRRGVLYSLVYPVISSGGLNLEDDRAKALLRAITERAAAAIVDLHAGDLLPP